MTSSTKLSMSVFAVALLALVATLAPLAPSPALAADADTPPDWIFPVVGEDGVDFGYRDTFGACRSGCTRRHHGVDIGTYGIKGVPVVAAADGVVRSVNWSSNPDYMNPDRCCTIALRHEAGWETWYIHLDNDTPGTDDGQRWGIAPGIVPGVEVYAGQLIGWVGDSGNAEGTSPHLHWEVHAPGGVVVNPTPHADAATRIPAPILPSTPPCETGHCDTVITVNPGGIWRLWDAIDSDRNENTFYYGNPGDVPFSGDWNGDGVATPGLYRQSDGYVYIRHTNTQGIADETFYFGNPGDFPIVGDFDGDGKDTVSVWRASENRLYVINELGENDGGLGAADYYFEYGNPGDTPFVGDWDGDGVDTIGVWRSSNGNAYLLNSEIGGIADHVFSYDGHGSQIFAGDWDGDGDDSLGRYNPSSGLVSLHTTLSSGTADWESLIGSYSHVVTGRGTP